eukprot:tig00001065_g6720.t1
MAFTTFLGGSCAPSLRRAGASCLQPLRARTAAVQAPQRVRAEQQPQQPEKKPAKKEKRDRGYEVSQGGVGFAFRKKAGNKKAALSFEEEQMVNKWVAGKGPLPPQFSRGKHSAAQQRVNADAPAPAPAKEVLENAQERLQVFEALAYPCPFIFKAVGLGGAEFALDLVKRVEVVIGRPVREDEWSTNAKGKYTSLTVTVEVASSDQIYQVYASFREDERLKFTF